MALIGAGVALGFSALSGILGGRSKKKALERLRDMAFREYRSLGEQYMSSFTPILDTLRQERATNIQTYRSDMQASISSYEKYFDQARKDYETGYGQAIGAYETGRENTIEILRQQVKQQQRAAKAAQAFSGVGLSSFGQQRVAGIGTQGVLQEGAIREQYAQGLSNLYAQQAAGLSSLSAQQGAAIAGTQQAMASGVASMYQSYGQNMANLQSQALSNQYNILQQGYGIAFGAQQGVANLAGNTMMQLGNLAGSVGGALLGAGLQGLGSAGAGAGAGAGAAAGSGFQTQGMGPQQFGQMGGSFSSQMGSWASNPYGFFGGG
jgi:hypothetical protein